MPKGEYTPARRIAMQAILWLVLLGTIGLAALVDQHITNAGPVGLGIERSAGPLHYRLPAGWQIHVRPRLQPLALIIAADPGNRQTGTPPREITIYLQQIRNLMPPADYLESTGLMEDLFGEVEPQTSPAVLAGHPALLLQAQGQLQTEQGILIESDIVFCCIFPNHQAVTIRLTKFGEFTSADAAVLDRVARSVRMDNADRGP